jgi:hypothetical protein
MLNIEVICMHVLTSVRVCTPFIPEQGFFAGTLCMCVNTFACISKLVFMYYAVFSVRT